MKFPIYAVVLVIVVAIIGGVALWRELPTSNTSGTATQEVLEVDGDGDRDGDLVETANVEDVSPSTQNPEPSTSAPSGYTMAQVSAHASLESCWTAIEGNIYDLTSWIAKHPGGKNAILGLCGKDGTSAFNAQHGGQARPEQQLASFKIGALI